MAIVGALLTGSFGDKGVPIARPQMSNGNAQRLASGSASKKLLVCAPSNAAVDELVMRFKQGVRTADGNPQKLSVIRLGRSDAINANVMDVTLEELVNAKLNLASGKKTGSGEDIHQIMMAHKTTCDELNAVRANIDVTKASGKSVPPEQDREFEVLKRKKQQLSNQIDAARDSGDAVARDAEMSRRHVQQEILDSAHVICATLSGSGHEMFQGLNIEFETVVIDEAAQSIELSALIPLKYGCSKCILVGDPKQLPPTVLSREAARFQYEQSLFVRMQANHPNDVHLLDTQYRMHPEISLFPSNAFYDGRLLDGPSMGNLRTRPWHESKVLGPYRFFDVQGTHQSAPRGHSLINIAEIEVALKLFERLTVDCRGYDFNGRIGIITPYKSQLRELRSRFAQKYGNSIFTNVEFNTTDAFQGRESEVIIFSCVRASLSGGIGFLSDIRRMNVGITRAKSSLWVLGNAQSLMRGEFWGRLIQDAKRRDRYTGGDLITLLRKPLLHLDSNAATMGKASPVPNSPSTSDHNVNKPDASVFGGFTTSSRRGSGVAGSPVDSRMLENTNAMGYHPAGGANGLNTNSNCQICGSFAHYTSRCNNEDAIKQVSNRCFRCGEIGHAKAYCTAVKCLLCGEIGHLQNMCRSTNSLSKKEKERVGRAEAEHKLLLQRAPEYQRRKQLGDHDMQVPIVRSTSTTEPPSHGNRNVSGQAQQTGEKRKRELSPPPSAPEGPKSMGGASRQSQTNIARAIAPLNQSLSNLPNGNTNGSCGENSAHSIAHPLPSRPTGSVRFSDLSALAEARKADKANYQSRDSYNASPGGIRDPRLPMRPSSSTSQIIRAEEETHAAQTARPPPPPQGMIRPPKQRKDADPFIRPKKRR